MFALDLGAATASAALIGEIDGHRRLLASASLPAGVADDELIAHLLARFVAADPELAATLGAGAHATWDWPRLVARSTPPPILAVLATTVREGMAVERVAGTAGWRTTGASLEADGPIELTRIALERQVDAIAVAAGEPTSREERATMAQLVAVADGIARRTPGPRIVHVGAVAAEAAPIPRGADDDGPLFAPGPARGEPPGEPLRRFLDLLDPARGSARRAMLAAAVDLAAILDRRIELVEIGFDGGLRAVIGRAGLEGSPAFVPAAALVPPDLDDQIVDGVLGWSTAALDRHRLRDRLRDFRLAPWVEAHGEGALLRLAAARAALERLVRATPELDALEAPDLILVAGGAWAAAPGPVIALAIADVVRRPGASQLAFDHARLLGPLGTLEDPDERRALLGEMADDLLAPLGSVIVPRGLRAGRIAGRLIVRGSAGETELDLIPGGLQLVDLPPGELAIADFQFRDQVDLGTRGRHVRIEVGGGLGGLLVDLRDIPLRLPERAERRRALLAGWQAAFWADLDG
jgi:hypothetical protein